jgi:hypothetical protein
MLKESAVKALIAGAAIAGITGFVGAGYGAGVIVYSVSHPCVTEDSSNCFWDAGRGNGLGHSFVDINGTVFYIN